MGIFDGIGDAVENAVEAVTEKAGEVADAGLDKVASAARWAGADGVAETLDDLGDHVVDVTGGEVHERELGQSEDPKELVRGEPSAIGHAVEQLRQMGDSINKTGDALRTVNVADWTGDSAEAFHTEFAKQPKLWWDGADAMHAASAVFDTWFHEVSAAQAKAADAIAKWQEADAEEHARKSAWNALSTDEKKNTPLVDTWTLLRDAARDILRGARTQRDNAAATAVSGLSKATESAPTEPPFTERMAADFTDLSAAGEHAKLNFTKGLLTSFTGIVQFVRQVSPMDTYNMTHPAQYLQGMSDLGTGMVVAAADPGAAVSAILSDARKNPSEFVGALTGDLITTVGTGGAGAAKPALSAVREIKEVSSISRATHAAADVAEHAPHGTPARAVPHVPDSPGPAPHEVGTHPAPSTSPHPSETSSAPHDPGPSPAEPATRPGDAAGGYHASDPSPQPPGPHPPETGAPYEPDGLGQPRDTTPPADSAAPSDTQAPHPEAGPHTEPAAPHSGDAPEHPHAGDSTHPGTDHGAGDAAPPGPDHPHGHDTPADRAEADHGAHDTASDSGPEHDRTGNQKTCSEDPVDIATGEFLLPDTDIDLPGVLRLVLRRTHRSNYRFGRWFGPSWSATLDMRLVVEHEGVTFLGEDGIMLAYPHAAPGTAVEPVTGGQRWTLTRTDTGGYRVWDQQRELIWHFAPEPGLGGLDSRLGNYALSALTDRHRNRIRVHYDTGGTPTEVSHSGGYRVRIDTTAGRITTLSVVDRGTPVQVREFGYSAGELVSVTNGVGAITAYTYDDAHRMTSWTDSNGNRMVNTYDESGRVIFQRGTAGVLDTDYDYLEFPDGTGSLTTVTDSLGGTTRHGFDRDLRLRDLIDPAGGRTHLDYNADRRPLIVTAPDCAVTRYVYTGDGDVAAVTRPDGARVAIEYMFRGRPTKVTDPDGSIRHQEWDELGNLTAVVDPAGARTEYRYHPHGAIAEIIESTGAHTHIATDAAGLPVAVTDPNGATTRIARDGFGRPVVVTDASGAATRYDWSPEGHLLRRTDSDGEVESWTYDGEGNVLTHTDRAGGVTRHTYGPFDLLTARTDPDGATTRYQWDAGRRLTAVTNPLGDTWTYTYDQAGRRIAETDYAGATTTYTHDRAGRIATVTTPTGVTRHHTHDILGRLTAIHADTGDWLRYTHDPAGRTLTATSGTGDHAIHTLEFAYTATGQLHTQTLDDQPPMRHDYDRHGRRTTRTTPSGATTTWQCDHSGRVRELTADGHTTTFTYDHTGRPVGWRLGELDITRTLTPLGQVQHQRVTAYPAAALNLGLDAPPARPDSHPLREDDYTYRRDGYLTAHTTTRLGTTPHHRDYRLDPIGRITALTTDGTLAERYDYDPLGNITAAALTPTQTPATHPEHAAGQTVSVSDEREYRGNLLVRDGRTTYHYDAAGRLVRKVTDTPAGQPAVWHFRYNAFDQLVDVHTPDHQWWHYTYDALGRRTTKQQHTTTGAAEESRVRYTWDGNHVIEEATSATTTRWQYHPDSYTPLIQTRDSAHGRESSAIVTDPVGTPATLIDPDTATTRATATLTAWGETLWEGTTSITLRYPGQLHDPETGLHYNLHRTYDPATGRFLTPDPLGLGPAPNPNTYPHNPTRWLDPLGLIPAECGPQPDPTTPEPHQPAPRDTLYHYTNEPGMQGILDSQTLHPSLKANNPADARYGDGQYLSDIAPGTRSGAQLSRAFIGQPFQGARFSHFVEIDITGLNIFQGRPNVFVVHNTQPLDLAGRIISWGANKP